MSMSPSDLSKFALIQKARLLRASLRKYRRGLIFGDSISQNNSSFDTTHGTWALGMGYGEQAFYGTGGKYTVLANAGISGNTTTQMRARFVTDVLAYKPDVVLFMAGTNDLVGTAGNAELATQMNNIEYMVIQMLANNILPVIVTPPVKGQYEPDGTTAIGGWSQTREAIRFYYLLANYYGLPLVDAYKVTCDAATGNYHTGTGTSAWSSDNVHPNKIGITNIARAAAAVLNNLDGHVGCVYYGTYSDPSSNNGHNLIANGTFANLGPDNVTPYSWGPNTTGATLANAAVPIDQVVSGQSPFPGNIMAYQKTDNNGAYAVFGATVSYNTSFTDGDTMVFSGYLGVQGMSATPQGCSLQLEFGNGGAVRPMSGLTQDAQLVFSQEFVVPTNCGDISPTFYVQDAATYSLGGFTLWNKTKTEAIWKPGQQ